MGEKPPGRPQIPGVEPRPFDGDLVAWDGAFSPLGAYRKRGSIGVLVDGGESFACWRCSPKIIEVGFDAWESIAHYARIPGQAVHLCKACWEACPLRGALSLVDGEGGELTVCSTGQMTLWDGGGEV